MCFFINALGPNAILLDVVYVPWSIDGFLSVRRMGTGKLRYCHLCLPLLKLLGMHVWRRIVSAMTMAI
jgi:hypothetical protein